MPDFAFASCLPGIESAVKLDVASRRPELKFAYSRPGLLTFKSPRALLPEDPPGSVFARVWGRSVGAASDPAAAAIQLGHVGATRVHVFARDPDAAIDLTPWLSLGPGGPALDGEVVADVIVSPEGPAWLGVHRHEPWRSPHPGGGFPVDVPEDAPSRAYAKIEEAIAWARLPVAEGQRALEIGAAPGGAVLALARRGVAVWGVDTGELAPNVLALPNVTHIAKKVGALRWEEMPGKIDWLLLDVNLAPQVALHEVARLMPRLRDSLRGAVFTLKMNDWAFVAELPRLVERIREMGFRDVRLRHLPSNRREVCAVALM
ncbi:MAG: putative SAM-depedent methyltransferase [Myxococcales bacterium]|nr:putative SAM-depedent methyltransferase [Myxococcales bacterium]